MTASIDPPSDVVQERANFALKQLQELGDSKDRYVVLAQKISGLLRREGLGNTLAFLRSKSGAHAIMYEHLSERLFAHVYTESDADDILEAVITSDVVNLLRATQEALLLADKMNRISRALYGDLRHQSLEDSEVED